MKVLLSAYACRPNHGSEPAVGWNWAIEIAKLGHEVTVLTRKDNREFIETESASIPSNLKFIYYDLPSVILKAKKITGIYFYYTLWQAGAYLMIKKRIKEPFDIVQHITYVSYRFPIFLYKLKGKFIFGPIAGGEESSPNLTATLPFIPRLLERMRTCINTINSMNLFINRAYLKSYRIFAATNDTFDKIPEKYKSKTSITPAIGINKAVSVSIEKHTAFTILYAGQLLYWKGIHIALESFAKAVKSNPAIRFKIVGSGKYKAELVKLAADLNVSDKVEFISKLPQKDLYEEYRKAHVFLFPSLHDSGGFVVIEAMAHALPVICLDKGGPPVFVGKETQNVIPVQNKTIDQITTNIATLLADYSNNSELLKIESEKALSKSENYEWSKIVRKVYDAI
ncbi:glycosyltransferase family 4 protein [Flavobacterium sp.]|uniref:glycosyltransferase family 4 protein n=1 Tax=Flavobacterium sp. TaxID=239 RepID=UPI0025C13044|nr:glycosyltransferase family 4 protein [Flavobacterium sp.]